MIEIKNLKTNETYKSFVAGIEPEFPSWVICDAPTRDELYAIQKTFNIPWEDLEDALDEDERPRLEIDTDFVKLVLRVPSTKKLSERVRSESTTRPAVAFLKKNHLITIQNAPIQTKRSRKPIGLRKPRSSPTTLVLLDWLETIVKSFELAVDLIDQRLAIIESDIFRSVRPSSIETVFELSRNAIYLDAALKGNLRAFYRLQKVNFFIEDKEILDDLEDLSIDLQQQNELLNIYRDLIENSLDAYASVISNNQNDLLKVLASISLILTIPTMLSSLYGMNVPLPFQNDSFAFWYILFMSIIIIVPIWIVLKKLDLL